jgi:hypothetical protein
MRDRQARADWIYYRLRRQKLSTAEVGRRLGVTARLVRYVISGQVQSPRVRRGIAAALGLDYERLWGETPPNPPLAKGGERGGGTHG